MGDSKSLVSQESSDLAIAEANAQADQQIAIAQHWATKLIQIVEKCHMAQDIAGKKYLMVEGWQVIGEFAHVRPIVEWTKPWRDDVSGDVIGYEARVLLHNKDGEVVSSGESSCGFDAFPCRGKDGSEKQKAARSAAQTWAASRAYRNKFAFVAKLGGYEPTPAEEMTGTTESQETMPNCPKCGHNKSVIRGKAEWGGGLVCWKNHKITPGCGASWKNGGNETPQKAANLPKNNVSAGNKASIYQETDSHKTLEKALFDYCEGDFIKMGDMLQGLTQWESGGKIRPGKKEIGAISEKMAIVALDKFQKEFGVKV